ncbi:3-deoxy-D-manno-octulosonic acid transferase [Chlamydiales bacterium STE3]|nr:3-deoxy-D-manno-octulosonic acid transferase [Chlamydiales bacterium STE3]
MFFIVYNFFLAILFLLFLPKMLYQCIFLGKYRKSFWGRLGRGFDLISRQNKKLIWIHAPSLGETKAVIALASIIKNHSTQSYLLITSTTETGHEEAKKSIPFADSYLYLPFDFSWIVRPIIRRLKPDLVLLCESDFWYNFLDEAKRIGTNVVLVNGKLSLKSLNRYLKFPLIAERLFSKVDVFCVQSNRYAERFKKLGIASDKIAVTGNIKLDTPSSYLPEQEILRWKERLKIEKESLIVVAGSTHDPEEKLLLNAFSSLWQMFPNVKLFLVPRHPERFNEVASLLKNAQIPFVRLSHINQCKGHEKVIFFDSVGILKLCYQIGDIAIVGGSFTDKVGGHNILEPCYYSKPVIYGPYMHSQLDLVDAMREFKTGIQADSKEIRRVLTELLASSDKRIQIGSSGLELINAMQGASERTFQTICNYFIF